MNKFTERLRSIYADIGNGWVEKNEFVFSEAKTCGLALAGSIGGAVASKKAKKIPGDIDFVCRNVGQAMRFHARLQDKLLQYPTFWQIQINNRTKFCPENVETHLRFHAPFWLPVCVFVLKDGRFRQWFTPEAYPVQLFEDVKREAKEMEKRDGKERRVLEEPVVDFVSSQDDDVFFGGGTPLAAKAYPAPMS